jgi:hypothetical protein
VKSRKAVEMGKPLKELVPNIGDEDVKVFVRASPEELTVDDLEVVAGGRRSRIVPDG